AFLTFCDRVVYPSYLSAPRPFHISPLQDQERAGALMWVFVTLVYLIPAVAVTIQILSPRVEWRGAEQPRNSSACFHGERLNSLEHGSLGLPETHQQTRGMTTSGGRPGQLS